MKGEARITDTKRTEITLTLTATAEEWRDVAKQMPSAYPGWKFSSAIIQAIAKTLDRIETVHEVDP